MRLAAAALVLAACALVGMGCGRSVKEEEITSKSSNDPLDEPRNLLKNYGDGQPLGSEVTSFPTMIENVKKVDPERAVVLEKGLEALQKAPPGERAGLAKELHKKLQPSMK